MNNTKKTLNPRITKPSSEIIKSLKSFARSYEFTFSKKLNNNIDWVSN